MNSLPPPPIGIIGIPGMFIPGGGGTGFGCEAIALELGAGIGGETEVGFGNPPGPGGGGFAMSEEVFTSVFDKGGLNGWLSDGAPPCMIVIGLTGIPMTSPADDVWPAIGPGWIGESIILPRDGSDRRAPPINRSLMAYSPSRPPAKFWKFAGGFAAFAYFW